MQSDQCAPSEEDQDVVFLVEVMDGVEQMDVILSMSSPPVTYVALYYAVSDAICCTDSAHVGSNVCLGYGCPFPFTSVPRP